MSAYRPLDIAVDFDGTIFHCAWPKVGRLKFGAKWVLKQWGKTHTLILWTCREGAGLEQAKDALREHGLLHLFSHFNASPPHVIELFKNDSRKIGFDIQIDDKASFIFWPYQYLRIMWKAWRVNHG